MGRGGVRELLGSRFVLFSCEGAAEGVVMQRLYDEDVLAVPSERVVVDPMMFRRREIVRYGSRWAKTLRYAWTQSLSDTASAYLKPKMHLPFVPPRVVVTLCVGVECIYCVSLEVVKALISALHEGHCLH